MSKRIVFDARRVDSRIYGIERYSYRLIEALAQASPQLSYVVLRGNKAGGHYDWQGLRALPNVTLAQAPARLSPWREQLMWPGLLRRLGANLFHSPTATAPLLSSIPALMTVHDLIAERFPATMPGRARRVSHYLWMELSTRRAQRVVTSSQATASDVQRFYAVPQEKVLIAREGIDPGMQSWQDEGRREALRYRYRLHQPFIMAVGELHGHNNFEALVEAFGLLAPYCEHELIFTCAGDNCFPEEARQAARRLGLEERVRFVAQVAEADVPGFYSLAQAVVAPSPVDGSGLPLLEAMACGAPALVNDAAALPEVAGNAALLVNAADRAALAVALRSLLNNDTLQTWLAKAGAQRAARFTWAGAAAAIEKAYNELL